MKKIFQYLVGVLALTVPGMISAIDVNFHCNSGNAFCYEVTSAGSAVDKQTFCDSLKPFPNQVMTTVDGAKCTFPQTKPVKKICDFAKGNRGSIKVKMYYYDDSEKFIGQTQYLCSTVYRGTLSSP